MAYFGTNQSLSGLFDSMAKVGAARPKAVAQADIPEPVRAALGVQALQPTRPWSPLGMSEALAPAAQPLGELAPPQASATPPVTAVPVLNKWIAAAYRIVLGGEAPVSPAAGSSGASAVPSAPVAAKMTVAPSGAAPSGLPVDAETRAAVNGEGKTIVPLVGAPSWLMPALVLGGAFLLFKKKGR